VRNVSSNVALPGLCPERESALTRCVLRLMSEWETGFSDGCDEWRSCDVGGVLVPT
jgi:hypothetical protein